MSRGLGDVYKRQDCDRLAALGMRVIRVDERSVEGEHVSSTAIRRLVEAGRIAEAERLLGHRFRAAVQETPATAETACGEKPGVSGRNNE